MKRLAIVLWFTLCGAALAFDPSEMLDDPALEARARALDDALRCVVCQSESVGSSNADWAVEARQVIREQVAAGKTDAEVEDFFVERYGEFVLMNPRSSGSNLLLWLAGPLMFLFAGVVGISYLRGRSRADATGEDGLNEDEARRLAEILKE